MDILTQVFTSPIVQVLIGAVISAWVALRVAQIGIKAQSRQAKLDFLTRIDRDLLEMLRVFEPLPYSVDDSGRTTQGSGQITNFERIRSLYFKHSILIKPDVRAALDLAFVRAESAYLLLLAPNETAEFKRLLVLMAERRGAKATDLLEMPAPQLRLEITSFCSELRSRLMSLRDETVARIEAGIK